MEVREHFARWPRGPSRRLGPARRRGGRRRPALWRGGPGRYEPAPASRRHERDWGRGGRRRRNGAQPDRPAPDGLAILAWGGPRFRRPARANQRPQGGLPPVGGAPKPFGHALAASQWTSPATSSCSLVAQGEPQVGHLRLPEEAVLWRPRGWRHQLEGAAEGDLVREGDEGHLGEDQRQGRQRGHEGPWEGAPYQDTRGPSRQHG
mmetsp:Transcript_14762/g.42275  ORF Transcript_14762/g.42275 Transcript_14762/m.42275 type:complete len:206 (+) Transcript_14762:63-680(+)